MTVDMEGYYQVSAFERVVAREQWDRFDSHVCRNTDRLLGIFADADTKGTFFVLGWVAERHPDLVRRIALAGHEIASHGYSHRLVYDLTMREFREDVRRSKLETDPGQPRIRAPLASRFRHYGNLRKTEARLRQLIKDLLFEPVSSVLARQAGPGRAQVIGAACRALFAG